MKEYAEDIKQAVEVMRRGGVILYPTDTIWGLGCDASNEQAVERIFAIKQRDDAKSMLCLVDSFSKLEYYVESVPSLAYDLIDLADKPLTIIYDKARNVAPKLIAEDGSIGIRVTAEEFSKELCMRMRGAVVSTSANISGQPSAKNFAQIDPEIVKAVDYVVKYRQTDNSEHKASGIIKLGNDNQVKVIRE